jgi:2-iminobutanoate/2-iminopropanoate deaminase
MENKMKIIQTDKAPAAIGPYSQAICSGGLLFTSGQIPLVPETGMVAEGAIREQTLEVIRNLKAVLEAAGSSLDKVVKTTCFLTDMNAFAVFNEVYAECFSGKPARSTVAVKKLPRDVLVEIEAVAEL